MRLKVTLQRRGTEKPSDIVIDADAGTTVGSVAREIMAADPKHASVPPEGADDVSLRVVSMNGTERVLASDRDIVDSAIQSGDTVSVAGGSGRFVDAGDERAAAATIQVSEG